MKNSCQVLIMSSFFTYFDLAVHAEPVQTICYSLFILVAYDKLWVHSGRMMTKLLY